MMMHLAAKTNAPTLFVTGGWGYGNIGDDAILLATLRSVRASFPRAVLHVSSFSPPETKFHHAIDAQRSFHSFLDLRTWKGRTNFARFAIWLILRSLGIRASRVVGVGFRELLDCLEDSDLVVMAGGGYFNDRWRGSFVARIAEICASRAARTPILIYGQTVGPFASGLSRIVMPTVLGFVSRIAYRDVQSEHVLRSFGYPTSRSVLTADEANLIPVEDQRPRRKGLDDPAKLKVGIMIQKFRPYEGPDGTKEFSDVDNEGTYFEIIVNVLVRLYRDIEADFVFLPSTTWDVPFCSAVQEAVQDRLGKQFRVIVDRPVAEYLEHCRSVDLMLSTNMHPIILASAAGIPCVAISYFYKVDDFMESIGLQRFVIRIDKINEAALVQLAQDALNSRHSIRDSLVPELQAIRVRAHRNIEQLVELANEIPAS